jgi:hypothetical protein
LVGVGIFLWRRFEVIANGTKVVNFFSTFYQCYDYKLLLKVVFLLKVKRSGYNFDQKVGAWVRVRIFVKRWG